MTAYGEHCKTCSKMFSKKHIRNKDYFIFGETYYCFLCVNGNLKKYQHLKKKITHMDQEKERQSLRRLSSLAVLIDRQSVNDKDINQENIQNGIQYKQTLSYSEITGVKKDGNKISRQRSLSHDSFQKLKNPIIDL